MVFDMLVLRKNALVNRDGLLRAFTGLMDSSTFPVLLFPIALYFVFRELAEGVFVTLLSGLGSVMVNSSRIIC